MKKIVAAFIAGALLMFSAQAFGTSSNLVGLKVSNTANVNLDGKQIGQAVVIEGKSYIPVRSAADGLNLNITKASGGVIDLESTSTPTAEELAQKAKEEQERLNAEWKKQNEINNKIVTLKQDIESIKRTISDNQKQITDYEAAIKYVIEVGFNEYGIVTYTAPDKLPAMYNKDTLTFAEGEVTRLKAENVTLQAKVTQLEAELVELEK